MKIKFFAVGICVLLSACSGMNTKDQRAGSYMPGGCVSCGTAGIALGSDGDYLYDREYE